MGAHINEKGQWQSDKFPTTPADKVPLSVNDKTAQDLLWEYAQRRRKVDSEFSDDLETRLKTVGFEPPEIRGEVKTTKEERDHLRATGNFIGNLDALTLANDLEKVLARVEKAEERLPESTELAALRALVIEIAHHFDPMFAIINLHRLDDRWMDKAAKVVGEDVIYPWIKKDRDREKP